MLDLGFNKDIKDVMKHIPKNRQTLFFSATISKKIKSLAYDVVRDAIRIQISPKNPVAQNIDHAVAFIQMDDFKNEGVVASGSWPFQVGILAADTPIASTIPQEGATGWADTTMLHAEAAIDIHALIIG